MSSDNESETEVEPEAWVKIQKDTFGNWVNDKLRVLDLEVNDLKKDLKDGVKLCKLVEVLQGDTIGKIIQKKNINHYEASGNLALALNALQKDGVRLVNIGAEDIAGGNLKLILGMIWVLIRKYQIGSDSRLPPKKLMLSWVNAVLHPHLEVANFSTDWNDGIALHGVIEYCQPGTFPDWHALSGSDRYSQKAARAGNCEIAMNKAQELFEIPLVVSPENFASPNLDELSGMTYVSYFMMEGAPGYNATMRWVKNTIDPEPVENFETDWNNGYIFSVMVHNLGGDIPGWPDVDTSNPIGLLQKSINVSESQLKVPKILQEKDMANPKVDHIGVMAYAAWHQSLVTPTERVAPPPPPPPPPEPVREPTPPPVVFAPPPTPPPEPEPETPPPTPPPEPEPEPPVPVVAEPPPAPPPVVDDRPELDTSAPSDWRINGQTTIIVNTATVGDGVVTAFGTSPSGAKDELRVHKVDPLQHHVAFPPTEKGHWQVEIFYNGNLSSASPHFVNVYDSSLAKIVRSHFGPVQPGQPYTFEVDCGMAGYNEVHALIRQNGRTLDSHVTKLGMDRSSVTFTPPTTGMFSITVYCGGADVPESPFVLEAEEAGEVFASGEGLYSGIAGRRTTFDVDTRNYPGKPLNVVITAPSSQALYAQIDKQGDMLLVSYTPTELGSHQIDLTYASRALPSNPYTAMVRAPRVYVRNLNPIAYKNHETKFEMDASEWAKGTIELDSNLPVRRYDKIGERKYEVTIVPMKLGVHDLAIKMDGMEVDGSPYQVDVRDPPRY